MRGQQHECRGKLSGLVERFARFDVMFEVIDFLRRIRFPTLIDIAGLKANEF